MHFRPYYFQVCVYIGLYLRPIITIITFIFYVVAIIYYCMFVTASFCKPPMCFIYVKLIVMGPASAVYEPYKCMLLFM